MTSVGTPLKRKRSEGMVDHTLGVGDSDSDGAACTPQSASKLARVNHTLNIDSPATPIAEHIISTTTTATPPTTTSRPQPPPTSPVAQQITETASSQEDSRSLHDIPKIADRYIPRVSTAEGIEYTDPQKFCLKPAYWKRWSPQLYMLFAEYLRLQFDPVPFSKQTGIPVEEVRNVFFALVCNPLYSAKEAMRRGAQGMQEIMEAYHTFTESRPWGLPQNGVTQIFGDLSGVGDGIVEINACDGSAVSVKAQELSKEDIKYLIRTLSQDDMKYWKQTLTKDDKAYMNNTLRGDET